MLSGHTDVVPTDGQDWHTDPFSPEVKDQKLFGRDTCDVKGFIGTALALVPEMHSLQKPIHYVFNYLLQQVGCYGLTFKIFLVNNFSEIFFKHLRACLGGENGSFMEKKCCRGRKPSQGW